MFLLFQFPNIWNSTKASYLLRGQISKRSGVHQTWAGPAVLTTDTVTSEGQIHQIRYKIFGLLLLCMEEAKCSVKTACYSFLTWGKQPTARWKAYKSLWNQKAASPKQVNVGFQLHPVADRRSWFQASFWRSTAPAQWGRTDVQK